MVFLKVKKVFWIIFLLFDFCLLAAVMGGVYYLESDAPRHELEKLISDKIGREVVFKENLDIFFYPWLGFDTGPVEVASAPGADYDNQLTLKDIDFKVRPLPLLRGELEIDTVIVDSPVFRMDRGKNGRLDLPDVGKSEENAQGDSLELLFNSLSVRGVSVINATCIYSDVESGNTMKVSGVNVRTGPLRRGMPLAFDVRAVLDADQLDLRAETTVKGLADFSWPQRSVSLSETSVALEVQSGELLGPDESVQAIANLDFNLVDGRVDVKGLVIQGGGVRLSGSAVCTDIYHNPDFKGSLESTRFDPKAVFSKFTPVPIPSEFKEILNTASFSVDFHSTLQKSTLSNMVLKVDNTVVKGAFSLSNYSRPWVEFNVYADKLKLDPYTRVFDFLEHEGEGKTAKSVSKATDSRPGNNGFDLRKVVIADLVRNIPCKGEMEVGTLVYDGVHLDNTRLSISPGPKIAALSIGKGAYLDGDFSLRVDLDLDAKQKTDVLYLSGNGKIDPFSLVRIPLNESDFRFSSGKVRLKLNSLNSSGKNMLELFRNLRFDLELNGQNIAADLKNKAVPAEYRNLYVKDFKFDLSGAPLSSPAPAGLIGRKIALKLTGDVSKPEIKLNTGFNGDVFCDRLYPERVELRKSSFAIAASGSGLPFVKKGLKVSVSGGGSLKERNLSLDSFQLESGEIKLHGKLEGKRLASETASARGELKLDKVACSEIFSLFGLDKPETQASDAFESVELDTSFQLNGENFNLRVNNARLDNATADATFELVDFRKPFLNFVINGQNVDVDRFLPPDEDERLKAKGTGGTESYEVKLPEWEFPDSLLGAINATGKVNCDYFRIFDFGASSISADVGMQKSVIDIRNIKADFHKGNLAGGLALGLKNGTVTLDTDFECRGFDAGLFFADYVGRDMVNGRTDASLKIKGSSSANTYFTNSMTGSLAFKITDGSYLFESTAVKEKKQKKQAKPTSFSLMKGFIKGEEGNFKVADYLLKTDYLTATAKGGFSFPKDSISVFVKADIVKLPNLYLKLVNAFLGAMTGVNVTVTGKLSDPKVEVKGLERWSDVLNDVLGLPEQSFMFFRDLIF